MRQRLKIFSFFLGAQGLIYFLMILDYVTVVQNKTTLALLINGLVAIFSYVTIDTIAHLHSAGHKRWALTGYVLGALGGTFAGMKIAEFIR